MNPETFPEPLRTTVLHFGFFVGIVVWVFPVLITVVITAVVILLNRYLLMSGNWPAFIVFACAAEVLVLLEVLSIVVVAGYRFRNRGGI